ncbi:outer membrane beta-barrel protein [Robiginitalea sp.]|jgi:hypothetical protein|uniref:outer membrane beta-barrel protein n=2 Tax=Robiginitalea sp. TaxID=1902411 RepID=UPI003C765E51
MKNIFVTLLMLFGCFAYAQSGGSGFGLKGGLNFSGTGDLKIDQFPDISADSKLGYHVGVWGRFGGRAYVRPELVYTQVNSSYDGEDFKMQKLDLPVLFGHRFLKLFHGFVGPSFQYVLKTDLQDIDISDVENEFTVGFQIGGGLNLGKIGIDLRFERGFSPNYVDILGEVEGVRLDTRPTQWILGVSYKF